MSGHIIDMVNRIKQNKIQKRKKFQGDNRSLLSLESSTGITHYDFPSVSSQKLDEIKNNIRLKAVIRRRNSYLLLGFCILITIVLGLIFLDSYKYHF